jgi:DNA repair protein RadC
MKVNEITLQYTRDNAPCKSIRHSKDAAEIFRAHIQQIDFRETFGAILLRRNNNVISYVEIGTGSECAVIVDVKAIATAALLTRASSVIICHNHPSGNTEPSAEDKRLTEKVKKGLALLEIQTLDHIIITSEKYFSFADEGIM